MEKDKLKLKLHVALILRQFIDSYNNKEITKIFYPFAKNLKLL